LTFVGLFKNFIKIIKWFLNHLIKNIIIILLFLIADYSYPQFNWTINSCQTDPSFIHITPGYRIFYFSNFIRNYSPNLGLTWNRAQKFYNTDITAYFFLDSANGYFEDLLNSDLYKTTDCGNTWSRVGVVNIRAKCIFFINSYTGWISDNTFIYKTANGGMSWEGQYTSGIYSLGSIHFINQNTGFGTRGIDTFLITTNGGTNWVKRSSGTGQNLSEIKFINQSTGYILAINAVLKTTNSGINWQVRPFTGVYARSFDFYNENTGWLGNSNGIICKTTNGGINWVQKRGYVGSGPDFDILKIKCAGSSNCFAAQYNCDLIKTSNDGENWVSGISRPYGNLKSVAFINSKTGFVCNSNGKLWKTTNVGKTWSENATFSLFIPNYIYADSSVGCFISGSGNVLYSTTNYGNNWISIPVEGSIKYISFTSNTTGWICGDNGKIYKTSNGGSNWIPVPTGISGNLNCLSFADLNTGWFGSSNNAIFRTTNSGYSYDSIGVRGDVKCIRFLNATTGFITRYYTLHQWNYTYQYRYISKTTNGGSNWIDVKSDVDFLNNPFNFNSLFFIGTEFGFAAANNGELFGSSNSGANWFFINNVLSKPLNAVYFKMPDLGWVIGEKGLIMASGNAVIGVGKKELLIQDFNLSQNYPNPFNPVTNINYSVSKSGLVRITVFNILGKEIETLVNENLSPGTYSVTFDAGKYSSGIYFYRMKTEGFTDVKKMILLK
jgi:photosystem II stability/assembly factor-like uncharacterized protein